MQMQGNKRLSYLSAKHLILYFYCCFYQLTVWIPYPILMVYVHQTVEYYNKKKKNLF